MNGEPIDFHLDLALEKLTSPLVQAEVLDFRLKTFDESKARLKDILSKSSFSVLDVGPGFRPPNLSIDQRSGDVWVGVDVALGYFVDQKVARGDRDVDVNSSRLIVPGEVEVLPAFKADLIMMIAPNPRNIVEDDLLGQLEKFIGPGTKIYILLDNRTAESQQYGREAKKEITTFLKQHGFVQDEFNDLEGRVIDTSMSKDAVGGTVFKGKKIR